MTFFNRGPSLKLQWLCSQDFDATQILVNSRELQLQTSHMPCSYPSPYGIMYKVRLVQGSWFSLIDLLNSQLIITNSLFTPRKFGAI